VWHFFENSLDLSQFLAKPDHHPAIYSVRGDSDLPSQSPFTDLLQTCFVRIANCLGTVILRKLSLQIFYR
jgi:hypothetical protein